jgi:hypothetical protein
MWRGTTAAFAALALAGCAFGDVKVAKPLAKDVTTSSRRGEGRQIVVVSPFGRGRTQVRCGMKKNGYNVDTANVLCTEAPEVFLPDLLGDALADAGFEVYDDRRAALPSTIVLTGVVRQLFIEPKIDYATLTLETDLELELTAKNGAGLVATRRFYVKGAEASTTSSTEDMQRSLDSAVRELVAGVVGAVANLADAYPPPVAPPKVETPKVGAP